MLCSLSTYYCLLYTERRNKYLSTLLALSLAPAAVAQLTSFEVIDYPGSKSTVAQGINDAGEITGWYGDAAGNHGFLLSGGKYTTFDYPGARHTHPRGISRTGDIAGAYTDAGGKIHGFLLSRGNFTTTDFPSAENTWAIGINSRGEMVGMYSNTSGDGKHFGFLLSGGRFTTLDYPGSTSMSCAAGINDEGDIVGMWTEEGPKYHGYLWRKGTFTSIDVPVPFGHPTGLFDWPGTYGINPAGDLAGIYVDPRGKQKGYLLTKTGFAPIDVPGSRFTRATSLNALRQIVGFYQDSGGITHGFLTSAAPRSRSQILTVDDDGADCPGALRTIQEAVAQAPAGATVQVCPGVYFNRVTVTGPERTP